MIFEIVLLPEPFAPSRPVMRPALHARFPLDRATTPPNRFLIPVASRTFTLLPPRHGTPCIFLHGTPCIFFRRVFLKKEGGSVCACPPLKLKHRAPRRACAYLNRASAAACGMISLSR